MAQDSVKLELHFLGESKPSLSKLVLSHPIVSPPIIRRTFPMVAGVRGVCFLLLTAIQQQLEGETPDFFHVRHNPCLAPVWTACKKKKGNWPVKLLGLDRGVPILRRLVQARGKGTSRKQRYDNRKVKLNTEFVPVPAIEVYWQNEQVSALKTLRDLLQSFARTLAGPPRKVTGFALRSEPVILLKNLKRGEADELEYVKATVFRRLSEECPRADHLISWAEFFPCSLETDEFMRAHHESIYRDVMGEDSDWKDIVKSFNDSGANRRIGLEKACSEGKRTWKFVHMMFQSDLDRIASADEEYKRCTAAMKAGFFTHLLRILDNPAMNVELGYVPTDRECVLYRSKWKAWRLRYDSVVRVEAHGTNLFSFARDRDWRMRELLQPTKALLWLNAVRKQCVFDRNKVIAVLRNLRTKCAPETK